MFPPNLKFKIQTEVAAFDQSLAAAHFSISGEPLFEWASLEDAWVVFQQQEGGGRPFSALLDLRLAVAALQLELTELRREVTEEDRHEVAGESPDTAARLRLFRTNTAYILRTRSILEKVMGFVVMTSHPEQYDSFRGSKSRKAAFEKIAASSTQGIGPLAAYIKRFADVFDRAYRTPEAHDAGSVRTWVFGEMGGFEGPQADMFATWNSLRPILDLVASALKDARAMAG